MMLKFGVKVGLTAGAVYYLNEQGVWSNSAETEKLYHKISAVCKPYRERLGNQIPFEVPKLPESDRVSFMVKHYWNRGVQSTFLFVGELPENGCRWTRQGINAIKENKDIQNMFSPATPAESKVKPETVKTT